MTAKAALDASIARQKFHILSIDGKMLGLSAGIKI